MNTLVITGGSAGIGAATAARFDAAGWRVVNLSRRPCPVPGVTHLTCDLAAPGFVDAIADRLAAALEPSTAVALVHNAALMASDTAGATDDADLRAVLEVNLVAPNALNRFCVPYMKPGSSILYVGSTLSEKAVPGSYTYVLTKHAMVGMMRSTCQDLAGTGIHTACICPGFTDTEMLRQHVPADVMPAVQAMSAYNRLIEPGEIADTLFWAASSPVLNGALIHANLGQVER